jgi:XTP/dITP diphosphohydrolase
MRTVFIATGNAHKVGEIRAVLGASYSFFSQKDTNAVLNPDETGATFAENALIKAVTWAAFFGTEVCTLGAGWVLADDSGLEVDALGGAPGVYSARFAGLDDGRRGNTPDAENTAKVLRLLEAVPDAGRTARFRCALALTPVQPGSSPDELAAQTRYFDGACEGRIARQGSGGGGFGYDPVFIPEGYSVSFAELGESVKNQLSHRARALVRLKREWD